MKRTEKMATKLLEKVNKTPKTSNKVKRAKRQHTKKMRQHARIAREILKADNDEYVKIVQKQEKVLREYAGEQDGLGNTTG